MRMIRLFLVAVVLSLAGSAMGQATATPTPTNTPTPTTTPPSSNCSYKLEGDLEDVAGAFRDMQHFTVSVALTAATPVPVVPIPPTGKQWHVSKFAFQGEGCSAIETRLITTTGSKGVVILSDGVTDAGSAEVNYPIALMPCATVDSGLSVVSDDDCTAGVVVVEATIGK